MQLLRQLIPGNVFVSEAVSGIFPHLILDVSALTTETDPSGLSPSVGDRWLVGAGAIGDWSGKDDQIAEWNGSGWTYWEDISSIENWHVNGKRAGADYMRVCDEIKALISAWASLTATEKTICCLYHAGSHTDMVAHVGVDNLILYHVAHVAAVSEARNIRMAYAVSEVRVRLPDNYQEVIDDIIDNQNIFTKHNKFGRKGTEAGQPEGLVDYLDGVGSFVSAGLKDKGWTPEGMVDMNELVTRVKEIIIDGIY